MKRNHISLLLAAILLSAGTLDAQQFEPSACFAVARYEAGGAKATGFGPSGGVGFHAGLIETGVDFTATRTAGKERFQFLSIPVGIRIPVWKRASVTPYAAPYAGQHYPSAAGRFDGQTMPPLAAFFREIDKAHENYAGIIGGVRFRAALTRGRTVLGVFAEPSWIQNLRTWQTDSGWEFSGGPAFRAGLQVAVRLPEND